MRMRYKPLRGEKYNTDRYGSVTVLEVVKSTEKEQDHSVRVLNSSDKIEVVSIKALPLPTIDTKDYEKI